MAWGIFSRSRPLLNHQGFLNGDILQAPALKGKSIFRRRHDNLIKKQLVWWPWPEVSGKLA
jgi:hypothetical protein